MSMAAAYRSAAGPAHAGARMSNLSVNISACPKRGLDAKCNRSAITLTDIT